MNSEEVNQLILHYPKLKVLSVEKEVSIAKAMDHAMEELAQVLLMQENLLSQVNDILLAQYQTSSVLDDFLTQYDLWLLSKHYKISSLDTGVTQKSLSISLIHLQCDRSSVFEFLLAQASKIEIPLSKLTKSFKNDYINYRNLLVQGNIRLVMHITKRFTGKGVDTEELIQEGSLGLIKAAEKYNVHKGFRFSTYAYWWILQAVKQALSQKRSVIRIPTHVSDRIFKIELSKHDYYSQHEEKPTLEQLQKITGFKKEQIVSVNGITNLTVSMNSSTYEDGLMLEEILNTEDINDEDSSSCDSKLYSNSDFFKINDTERLKKLLDTLPERQQKIIYLYHGVGIRDCLTFAMIAPQIGLSLERTRQLYHKSIELLKEEIK